MSRSALVLSCCATIALAACSTIGPASIRAGRGRYQDAIRETGEQQMLLNIIRLQYDDLPFFLQVTSVTSQMQVNANLALMGGRPSSGWELTGNVGVSVMESPSVTYTPIQGEDFGRLLLERVPEDAVGLLFHGNQRVSLLFKLFVHDFGRLHNQPIKAPTSPERAAEYEEFKRVITSLDLLNDHGMVDLDSEPLPLQIRLRYENVRKGADADPPAPPAAAGNAGASPAAASAGKAAAKDKSVHWGEDAIWPVLRLRRSAPRDDLEAWCRLITEVGAVTVPEDSGQVACPGGGSVARYYFLTPSHLDDQQFELASHIPITTRTLLEVMTTASGGVSIPEGRAHGRPTATCDDLERNVEAMNEFFHVYCSAHAPHDAAVRVSWRGKWYFIKSDDAESRQVFSLLRLMFQMKLSRTALSFGPLLTLPVSH